MIRSPIWNFLLGILSGVLLGAAGTLHIVTAQVEARNAELGKTINAQIADAVKHTGDTAQTVIDAWQARAEKCEVRDRNATVLYEYRREELPGLPVLHGAFTVTLGSAQNHPGDVKPVWVIPAQVPVYSNLPGASYEWLDGKTGASIGRFPAVPPPAGAQ